MLIGIFAVSILGLALGGFLYAAGPAIVYTSAAVLFLSTGAVIGMVGTGVSLWKPEPAILRSLLAMISFIRRPANRPRHFARSSLGCGYGQYRHPPVPGSDRYFKRDRGRMNAVNSMFIETSNQLAEVESGVTAAWFGVMPAFLVGGLGTLLVIMVWMRLFPEFLHADSSVAASYE